MRGNSFSWDWAVSQRERESEREIAREKDPEGEGRRDDGIVAALFRERERESADRPGRRTHCLPPSARSHPLCSLSQREWLSLQELTSAAASSGESALSNHTHFAEQLWDQTAAILERVARGLESFEQLTDFFKGRKKAEEEAAKQMRMMCIVSGPPAHSARLLRATV